MSDQPLWPHQKVTAKHYLNSSEVLDFSDAGIGKTRGALEAFVYYRQNGGGRMLVTAPKTLLQSAWGDEIDKFYPHLRYSIAWANNREQAFSVPADIYITNNDAVKWLATWDSSFFETFDWLQIDESSDFKNHNSKRSKAMLKISKHFKRRGAMTGTPNSNSITDIYHQAKIVDQGKRLGTRFYGFRSNFCMPIPKPSAPQFSVWVDKEGATDTVYGMLNDILIRHRFEDVMPKVPGNSEYSVYFTPSNKLMKFYRELEADCVALLEDESNAVSAVNRAVLRQKLLQVASGSVYGQRGPAIVDNARTELVGDLVKQRRHSVVFYAWDHQREQLVKEFNKRKIKFAEIASKTPDRERSQIRDRYQDGAYQTLLMHPQTGAHGLTLTRGTATILVSPTDRADLMVQMKHRVYRGGQTQETECIKVCARGTVDELAYANVHKKRDRMQDFLDVIYERKRGKIA